MIVVDIMQIAAVRRIIEEAERAIEAETGAAVKLSIIVSKNDVVNFDFIVCMTASLLGLTKEDITGVKRQRIIADARKIICVLAKHYLQCTLVEIGNGLGNRDHTTALFLYNSALNLIHTNDALFAPKFNMVKNAFLSNIQRIKDESKAEQ